MLLVLSVIFCSLALFCPVCAANSIGFEGYQFSSSEIYQGASNVYVDLQIMNDSNSSLIVHGASVQFDWSNESFAAGSQRGGEPYDLGKELEPAEEYVIRIPFSVPLNVETGGRLFFFRVFHSNGLVVQWNPRAEDPYAELIVYNAGERIYLDLISETEDKVAQAQRAWFISPEARSILQHAEDNLNLAHSSADQKNWEKAASYVYSSSVLTDQAYEAEQRFRTYLGFGAVIGAGAVIGGVLLVRRKRRSGKETTALS